MSDKEFSKRFYAKKVDGVNKLWGESADIYEMKCLSKTDVNMIRARRWFDRPAYYTKFMEDKNNGKSVEEG